MFNIQVFLKSSFLLTLMFFSYFTYKAYAKQKEIFKIKNSFDFISKSKNDLASKYNINANNITKDDIIASLPLSKNWQKILLDDENLANISLNQEANFEVINNDRIKILVLKEKMNPLVKTISLDKTKNEKQTFILGNKRASHFELDTNFLKMLNKTISILNERENLDSTKFDTIISQNTPYLSIYNVDTKEKKENYFRKEILFKLKNSNNYLDKNIFNKIKVFI